MVKQSLFLMNEQLLLQWLQPHEGNLVDRLAKIRTVEDIVDELYISILTRFPNENEQAIVVSYLNEHADRRKIALRELAWSLLTSAEFRLNH